MTKHLPAEERHRLFLEAAGRVSVREGLAGVTMVAVARESGVSRGLLYEHFADLSTLLRAYCFHTLASTFALVDDAGDRPPLADAPADALRTIFGVLSGMTVEQRILLESLLVQSPPPDLAPAHALLVHNGLSRWRRFELLAPASDDQLDWLMHAALAVMLQLGAAVDSGILDRARAVETLLAIGKTLMETIVPGSSKAERQ